MLAARQHGAGRIDAASVDLGVTANLARHVEPAAEHPRLNLEGRRIDRRPRRGLKANGHIEGRPQGGVRRRRTDHNDLRGVRVHRRRGRRLLRCIGIEQLVLRKQPKP
jgi:hypothetical protein